MAPLLGLSFGSGCAALIYEIVWFQLLELVVGSSAISTAIVLGTFMGGMGLGTLFVPRWAGDRIPAIRVYALLELGIGLSATVIWYVMPWLGHFYFRSATGGDLDVIARSAICVLLLLPPTVLMGATLPVLARVTGTTAQGVSRLGACYSCNLAGAVTGCLLAGFYLLRIHDAGVASVGAIAISAATAVVGLVIPERSSAGEIMAPSRQDRSDPPERGPSTTWVMVAVALSGFCALLAQVFWTRLLSLMLGGTVYTFSIVLAVYLAGLGCGGSLGSLWARRGSRPWSALGWCQLVQVLAIVWADDLLTRTLPFWSENGGTDPGIGSRFFADLASCACAILPPTIAWGASFPLALAAGASPGADPALGVSRVYAANTTGAVIGAVLATLVLFPALGTPGMEVLLLAGSLAAGLVVVRPRRIWGWGGVIALVGLTILFAAHPSRLPWQLAAYGRHAAEGDQHARVLYLGEGSQATVAVTENAAGSRYFHVSGKTEASSQFYDMRLQRMLGHLPALLHPNPRSVLVVGMGAGVTAGSFLLHPSVERIVICEVEPMVASHVAGFFDAENNHLLADPRVTLVIDDARHFLAKSHEKFDVITTDPIHPWVKGAARLYSVEYLSLCRQHLNPDGFISQWVPFYQTSREAVQSELATFFRVFPDGLIWGNDTDRRGYDSILVGGNQPIRIDVDALEVRLARPENGSVRRSLAKVQLFPAINLLGLYAGRAPELKGWLANAQINDDVSLRLQYLAGESYNSHEGAAAYGELLRFRQFPSDLFVGNESALASLRRKFDLFDPATGGH